MKVNNSLTKFAAGVLSLAIVSACGKKKEEEKELSDTDPAPGAVIASGALNLNAMPDLSSVLQSSSAAGLRLAVVGEPPAFSEIRPAHQHEGPMSGPPNSEPNQEGPDKIEEYLTGDLDAILAAVKSEIDKGQNADWNVVDGHMKKFQAARSKCYVMQDAARQIGDLAQFSGSACYMSNIGKKGNNAFFTHVSGEEVAPEDFFTAPIGTSTPIVREFKITGEGEEQPENIKFHITNADNKFSIQLTFCTPEGKAEGSDVIEVDSAAGTMTFKSAHSGTDTYEDQEQSHNFGGYLSAAIKSVVQDDGSIKLVFDPSKARTMKIKGSHSSGSMENSFDGIMMIDGDVITTKFVGLHSGSHDNVAFSGSHKGYSSVRFSGSNAKDVKLYEGAGKHVGTWSGNNESHEYTEKTGFEYNENESPKYVSLTDSEYLTTVDVDFAADEHLSQGNPGTADNSFLSDEKCSDAASSVYTLDMQKVMEAGITEKCENHFDGSDRLCDVISNKEHDFWQAMSQRQQAEPQ